MEKRDGPHLMCKPTKMKVSTLILSAMVAGCLTATAQNNTPKNNPKPDIKVENPKPGTKPVKHTVKPKPVLSDSLLIKEEKEPKFICYACGRG